MNNIYLISNLLQIFVEENIFFSTYSLLYASLPVQKLHPCGDIISKLYKSVFYGGYFSHNTSYGSAATI